MAGKSTSSTPEKKWHQVFLAALSEHGNVSQAARAARIDRSTAYLARHADPAFAAAWLKAQEQGLDSLEDVAVERARTESDTLLIFLLKAHRPDKYRDRVQVDANVRNFVVDIDGDGSDPSDANTEK